MAAGQHKFEDPWSALVIDGKGLSERVETTMNLAQSEVARSREIVSTAHRIVSRSQQILKESSRTKMKKARQELRQPLFRHLPVKE